MPEDTSTTTPETPPPSGDPGASAPSPADPPKAFGQEDLNREAGKARNEGRRSAVKELQEQLGVTVEEAKKIIEEKRQADEAAKSEAERARDEAKTAKAEADRAKAEAAKERFDAKLERRLSAAGVGAGMEDEAASKLIARALRLIDLPADSDDEAIAAEIETLKGDVPGLFTKAEAGKQTVPSGMTQGRPPAGGQATGPTGIEAGREQARKEREAAKADDPFSRFHVVGRTNGT